MATLSRRNIRPPSGFEDHLSRREAADALGFVSEFKVRQLEREGRLHPIRGAMGSAWYPRAQVDGLKRALPRPAAPTARRVRWPDDALIALLRERPRTVVDLVVDAVTGELQTQPNATMAAVAQLLKPETLFDIGAETLNLVIPGGAIPLKVVKALADKRKK